MRNRGWRSSKVTEKLRNQIDDYVESVINKELPRISFGSYQCFIQSGSRKEFEEEYFTVRKQLTALGLYLMWNQKPEAIKYFNELLWSVTNEFSWCLVAHLRFETDHFHEASRYHIDLFAAETAATLSELAVIHKDIIDPILRDYMINQIKERVLTPFLQEDWGWETSLNNWCAVCSGSIGMAALSIEDGKTKDDILKKVDKALEYYLRCFGTDGETVEGIGYWVYGFGYYIYYIAMRSEMDANFMLPDMVMQKIKTIAKFPFYTQINQKTFLPFSDSTKGALLPTGLISYLKMEYGIETPVCDDITSFDFDHCYRFAHISRNLWWTDESVLSKTLAPTVKYFKDSQWLLQRHDKYYFAAKGGSNAEEHNHNDVGSFIFAIDGDLLLADLGAGPYTAGYFGAERYEYAHTRSYWHNIPLLEGKEQIATEKSCKVSEVIIDGLIAKITMAISELYPLVDIKSYTRTILSNMENHELILEENLAADTELMIEESFISMYKPIFPQDGMIEWKSEKGIFTLRYDTNLFGYRVEEKRLADHLGNPEMVYRLGLYLHHKMSNVSTELRFNYS